MARGRHVLPHAVVDRPGCGIGDTAVDLEHVGACRAALELEGCLAVRSFRRRDGLLQVGQRDRVTQCDAHVQPRVVLRRRVLGRREERDHDVGLLALRHHIGLGVMPPLLELLQHFLPLVAALGHIPLDFPRDAQLRVGIEKHRHVPQALQLRRV